MIQAPGSQVLYSLAYDSGEISVIDEATNTVTKTFNLVKDTPTPYYPYPYFGAVSPDGKTLYFTDSDYNAYAISTATGALEATYGNDSTVYPYSVPVLSLHGGHLYVPQFEGGNETNSSLDGGLDIIDTLSGASNDLSTAALPLPSGYTYPFTFPFGAALLNANGSSLYVAGYPYLGSTYDYGIAVIDLQKDTISHVVDLGPDSYQYIEELTQSGNGEWLYAENENGNLYIINTNTWKVTTVSLGTHPYAEALNGAETRLYVASERGGTLWEIDVNPASTRFATVLSTLTSGVPKGITWMVMAPMLSLKGQTITTTATPQSGQLVTTNITGCSLDYRVIQEPKDGSLSLNAQTGQWIFAPSLGALPASDSFSFEVSTVTGCANSATAAATVQLQWLPTFTSSVAPVKVVSGETSGNIDLPLISGGPVTLSAQASNSGDVPVITTSQDCESTCVVTVTGGTPGTARVTVKATNANGSESTAFVVDVTGSSSSGSGGGGSMGLLALAAIGALGILRRRRAEQQV